VVGARWEDGEQLDLVDEGADGVVQTESGPVDKPAKNNQGIQPSRALVDLWRSCALNCLRDQVGLVLRPSLMLHLSLGMPMGATGKHESMTIIVILGDSESQRQGPVLT
jgi:hypothetical protein